MAQASSVARQLQEEQPQATESVERKPVAERVESPVEQALNGGSPEKIVSIFKGRGKEERAALKRLGAVEPQEAEAAPEVAAHIEEANTTATQKIDAAEKTALASIESLLGALPVPANDVSPEVVRVMPTIKVGVGSRESEEMLAVEKSEETIEAEEQLKVAEEVMKENAEALTSFCEEHNVPIDMKMMKVNDVSRLSQAERFYVQTLMGKHAAGEASNKHAQKLLEAVSLPEGDPQRASLMQEAEKLAADATVIEKGAMAMQQNYMNLPEIMALSAGGGDETGGSVGGGFDAQASPFGGKPKGPEIGGPRGGGMYDGGGAPGSGLTKIEAYKTPGEKVEKRKPNFIERFVNKNWKDLTLGGGGDGGSRAH